MNSFAFAASGNLTKPKPLTVSFVVLETSISVILSFIALRYAPEEEFSPQGHTFVGTLLAFLTVFRSNTSYSLWEEGRICIGRVASASRVVANEILGAASDIAIPETETASGQQQERVRAAPRLTSSFKGSETGAYE